ncbi:MAG: hypothetical protein A2068_12530 [Ignavibacteria bacterium GWB2_35_6b]|nr:MAG: hypothetical protein A2068_12530 [Ignavibacteria bacterium GWB2_35_6b]
MKLNIILMPLFFTTLTFAQNSEQNWARVDFNYSGRMYVDLNSIQNVNDTLVSIWTMEENFPPLSIESVNGKIYKTKTYYIFNKSVMRYSLLEIIYFDEKDNVLNSFSYRRNTGSQEYQYNYPLIDNSIEAAILKKCFQFIEGAE